MAICTNCGNRNVVWAQGKTPEWKLWEPDGNGRASTTEHKCAKVENPELDRLRAVEKQILGIDN